MKQVLIILMLLTALLTCSVASGQEQKHSNRYSKAQQQLSALNRAWAEAITKGDAAALGRILSDDIIVTSGNGSVRDKAGEIKDAAGGADPDFVWTQPFTTEDVRIKVYGNAAVVTGMAKWGFRYKGNDVKQERRYTHLYVKQHSQWQIVAQQVSANLFKNPTTSP